jgi:membrane protease YdiL (CAAX protease family)
MTARHEAAPAGDHVVRWGLGDVALAVVVGLVLSALALSIGLGVTGEDDAGLGLLAVSQAALYVGYLGVPLWASRTKGRADLAEDYGLRVRPVDALVGIPVGVACQFVLGWLIYLPFDVSDKLGRPAERLSHLAHGVTFAGLAVVLVLVAPFVEEILFRGLLLRSLRRRTTVLWAVVGQAAIFGLLHFEWLQLPALIGFGLVCGWLAVRTGRLGPGIWAHAAFNAVAVVSLWLSR